MHNWMAYLNNIPVGAYNSQRLANIGLGHAAIDAGGRYTYFNPNSGRKFSAVRGFTQTSRIATPIIVSGVDAHLDGDVSQTLSETGRSSWGFRLLPTQR
jgi:hypothetical protein